MKNNFIKPVLRPNVSKRAAQSGLLTDQLVHLLVRVSTKAAFASTATLNNAGSSGTTSFRRRLCNLDLLCPENPVKVTVGAPKVQEQRRAFLPAQSFNKSDGVPKTLRGFYTSGFYSCDLRAMRTVSFLASSNPFSFVPAHSFVVASLANRLEDAVEAPIDDVVAEKAVAVRTFHPQTQKRLTYHLPDRRSTRPFRIALQKHEGDLLEPLRANQYHFDAELMTVANLSSGKFGAVNDSSKIEHRRKEHFLKETFSLAVVDGCHRRSSIQEPFSCRQPGTE